jgi:hypothetical protein
MPDSRTTVVQKQALLEAIKECVSYLEVHGLENIERADLRDAYRALDRMKVKGF